MDYERWLEGGIAALEEGYSLRRPARAQSMFKYVGLNTKTSWDYFEETIKNGVLRGSTSTSLNDPFEMQPSVFNDIDQYYIDENLTVSRFVKTFMTIF